MLKLKYEPITLKSIQLDTIITSLGQPIALQVLFFVY